MYLPLFSLPEQPTPTQKKTKKFLNFFKKIFFFFFFFFFGLVLCLCWPNSNACVDRFPCWLNKAQCMVLNAHIFAYDSWEFLLSSLWCFSRLLLSFLHVWNLERSKYTLGNLLVWWLWVCICQKFGRQQWVN